MRHAPLLIALAVATTARADGDPLHLAVHGSVDLDALGEALVRELGVNVAGTHGTCDVPCLDITVDGKTTATVVYVPRTGTPRARSVALGNDASQWPLVITLLAGNLVRDEAQDVLAGLPDKALPRPSLHQPPPEPDAVDPGEAAGAGPDAPAVAPPPPLAAVPPGPPAPDPEQEHAFFGFGLVPGLSTDLTHIGRVRHFLSIDLLVGVSGGSSGLAVAGIASVERGLVAGFQVASIASVAPQVAGTQVAGIAAVSGDVDGVQVAGIAAVAGKIDGLQAAGIGAVSRGDAGSQAAGIASVAGGDSRVQLSGIASVTRGTAGLQASGIASAAARDANVQISGISSAARGTANIQLAGVVNYARRVVGVQVAPINVAREVDGVQIGVVNVGGSADGFSFGLINIVPGGRYDLETAVDSDRIGTVLFRHGGRRWHNVYGVAGHRVDRTGPNDDVWMYGLGFGPSLAMGDTVIDLEAISWQVNHGPRHDSDISILAQLRLSVAHHWGAFGVVAGGILNTYVTNDAQSPLMTERRTGGSAPAGEVTTTIWPSAFVGIRI
jgi:hypothetical protein